MADGSVSTNRLYLASLDGTKDEAMLFPCTRTRGQMGVRFRAQELVQAMLGYQYHFVVSLMVADGISLVFVVVVMLRLLLRLAPTRIIAATTCAVTRWLELCRHPVRRESSWGWSKLFSFRVLLSILASFRDP